MGRGNEARSLATLLAMPAPQGGRKETNRAKEITAFIGTQSKKATYQAVQEFEKNLREFEDIDFESLNMSFWAIVVLSSAEAA